MKRKFIISAFAIILLALVGCAPNNRPTATPTLVAATDIPTATQTPMPPTPTAIPAATATPTDTPLPPLPTRAPIVLPTQTPTRAVSAPDIPTPPAPVARILAAGLNLRTGPSTIYPATDTLKRGDTVDITGVNATGEWYRVAKNGAPIGWISASPKYISTTPLVFDVPVVAAPPVSGGGSTFIIQPQTGGDIFRINADGNNLQRLTSGVDPALSPDGTKIAFTRWADGGRGGVWIFDLRTGSEYQLLGEMIQPKSPAWSPDGASLVVNFRHGGRLTVTRECVPLQSGQFPPGDAYDFEVIGFQLCYKLPPSPYWQLRRIDVASGTFRDLPSATFSFAPAWDTVNDWRIIFTDNRLGLRQLDVNRGVILPFTDNPRDRAPVFSPDGQFVAITFRQDNHWEIYTIRTTDGARRRLTPSGSVVRGDVAFNSAAPAWSPNGKQLAFVTDRRGKWEFWVMNANGTDPHPLFSADVAAQFNVQYQGVDERLINWGK